MVDGAEAQTDPQIITFGKEPEEEPNYLEGEDVRIQITPEVVQPGDRLTVRCVSGCPNPDISYTHEFSEDEANPDSDRVTVVFADPVDFPQAFHDGQPRWTGTWRVSLDEGTHTRDFEVFLADTYDAPTENYEPTTLATFRASGYPAEPTLLNFSVYHAPPDRPRTLVWSFVTSTGDTRDAEVVWQIPPSLATELDCTDLSASDCGTFELEVTPDQGDKGVESTTFPIDPADILVDGSKVKLDAPVNRTEEARTAIPLYYEASRAEDVTMYLGPAAETGATRNLTLRLERLPDTCGSGSDPEVVTTVTARWTPDGYLGNYTVPRDLILETAGSEDQFRWAVAEQEDAYRNDIPYQPQECWDIEEYELVPTMEGVPDAIERKKDETFVLNFTYADGTPLTEGDNATRLQGTLVPLTEDGDRDPAVEEIRLIGDHLQGGLWVWTHKYPRQYEHLGPWRFEFDGAPPTEDPPGEGTEDDWGNRILPNASDPFPLKPASPLIDVTTSVDGEVRNATRGFDRGDEVTLRVTTTYPDGTPLDADLLNETFDEELPVRIIRKDESGTVTQVTPLHLPEINPLAASWQGDFEIPEVSAGAPVGNWDIEVTVRDNATVPNENISSFDREVHPQTLNVNTLDPPRRKVQAGDEVSWAFFVRDSDGDIVTDNRTGDKESGTITVDVRAWDNGKPGRFVATGLVPDFDPDRAGGAWVMQWAPPRDLQPGRYLFAPNGTDIHGNTVAERAQSRPFDVQIERVTRDTIVPPPLTVTRGENVSVIFNGFNQDTGRNGSENPNISLERQTNRGTWVVEERNLYVPNRTGAGDHLAEWETLPSTPADTYRFHLTGRAPDMSIIDAHSEPFEVRPKNVTRPVLEPLVPFAEKGTTVTAVVGHRPFDDLSVSGISVSGPRDITDAPGEKDLETTRENWTVSWTIPVTVPKGEYVMHIEGEDRFGNRITATLGPVSVGPVDLTVEPLRLPSPQAPRNDPVEFTFRATYPDDSLMREAVGTPSAIVTQDGSPAYNVTNLTFDGVNWHARWVPPSDADLGQYRFKIQGSDKADNPIIPAQSRPFEVVTGTVERDVREGPPKEPARQSTLTVLVEADADDRFVEFELEYHGDRQPPGRLGASPDPVFTGPLSHEWRPSLGAYEVTWEPPVDQNIGWYVIRMTGEDALGNDIVAATEPFDLTTVRLEGRWLDEIEDMPLGERGSYRFTLSYPNGEPMTPDDGEPTVFLRLNGRPVEPRPDLAYDAAEGVWTTSWPFPEDVPAGTYAFVLRGEDDYGNEIPRVRMNPHTYEPGAIQQLTGATVPGPGAALAAAAVLVTAAAYGRVTSRR